MRIESEKPTQLPVDSTFHFGASTRYYILRERPQTAPRSILEELEEEAKSEHQDGGMLGLPESEMELDVILQIAFVGQARISMSIMSFLEFDGIQYGAQPTDLDAWDCR